MIFPAACGIHPVGEHLHPQEPKHHGSALHLVFPAKYRRAVFDAAADQALREAKIAQKTNVMVTSDLGRAAAPVYTLRLGYQGLLGQS